MAMDLFVKEKEPRTIIIGEGGDRLEMHLTTIHGVKVYATDEVIQELSKRSGNGQKTEPDSRR